MSHRKADEWLKTGVVIGEEVDSARIAEDVIIHSGCRILGATTSIGPGCVIGSEAPATLDHCQLGRRVELKGGFFSGATFFDGANMASGAHVRAGTILEEEANGAHTVGLKQTLLMPFTTLGSLINFCDVLMAGGTSRKDHSEVGSSYIHFNYTPHQDKATASLIGDVPRGVFLDQKPIFLGGQGGLVGPARIEYGNIVAAGTTCRKDLLESGKLHIPETLSGKTIDYETGIYHRIDRIIENNLLYIGNIMALKAWYQTVRRRFVRDAFDQACLDGGLKNLDLILAERIKRLGDLAGKMECSFQRLEANGGSEEIIEAQKRFHAEWPALKSKLEQVVLPEPGNFVPALEAMNNEGSYTQTIQSMKADTQAAGRIWLQSIVDGVAQLWR